MPKQRVVIIGSGFGGLFTAKALRDADVAVTLISKTSHHLFQPLLYQVATAGTAVTVKGMAATLLTFVPASGDTS